MTDDDLDPAEAAMIAGAIAYANALVAPLLARLAALEARPVQMAFKGVWRTGQTYAEGSAATHAGALWIALRDTDKRPGDAPDWVLAVKKGSA